MLVAANINILVSEVWWFTDKLCPCNNCPHNVYHKILKNTAETKRMNNNNDNKGTSTHFFTQIIINLYGLVHTVYTGWRPLQATSWQQCEWALVFHGKTADSIAQVLA